MKMIFLIELLFSLVLLSKVSAQVNGSWSNWGKWETPTCPVTCGGALVQRTRTRQCTNPPPQSGGQFCVGSGLETDTMLCGTNPCPVDGTWSFWGEWDIPTCPVTCGGGSVQQTRTRQCNSPPPLNGGQFCAGSNSSFNIMICGTNPCPVDGSWSIWSEWDTPECPVTCGGAIGVRSQSRQCNSPAPQNGGMFCMGPSVNSITVQCGSSPCPVNGTWSHWGEWETPTCPVTCGGGSVQQTRTRQCDSPPPLNGGQPCPGSNSDTDIVLCGTNSCPTCDKYTIYFVVDGSDSVQSYNFLKIKASLKSFIRETLTLKSDVKIGVVLYSDIVTGIIGATSDVNSLNRDIDNLLYPKSGTATHLGIDAARNLLLNDKFSQGKIMIVVTDGVSNEPTKTQESAVRAKGEGITISVIGITEFVSRFSTFLETFEREINAIASSPSLIFKIESFDVVANVTLFIQQSLCASQTRVDGAWTQWGAWTPDPCPVTCGTDAQRGATRTRTCSSPAPSGGGESCPGAEAQEMTLTCGLTVLCPGSNDNIALIVGVSVGAVVVLLLIVLAVWCCRKNRENTKKVPRKISERPVYTVPTTDTRYYENHVYSTISESPEAPASDPGYLHPIPSYALSQTDRDNGYIDFNEEYTRM